MQLNCDLGEDFGPWSMSVDDAIFDSIDQANIACGFHAGDPSTIEKAVRRAIEAKVRIGAHPGYPDLVGFGRRHMSMAADELAACLRYQIAALEGLTQCWGGRLTYVKPHGALYNDCVSDDKVRHAVYAAMANFPHLDLMLQAHSHFSHWQAECKPQSLTLIAEAFIDRRYQANGSLTPRSEKGAVLTPQEAIEQGRLLIEHGKVIDSTGSELDVVAQSLCVHGDNPKALSIARSLQHIIKMSS
ncbi:5-oxoprolinase subunit PxpA [Alteromonas oceanisediminis]|uniref:5-oxoprolinase subunit PxpA n=1 Tax=Alteromonas oceanisediminis TaxID=2836180 RepID=UPI001BDB6A64|nr:5-oxoprolinase subunit PxpA [Alteromonas oceanisediminis]MBT0586410.1 5-oxoprolinase subunit PxpA [Alteromonas oceanisediminis]